MISNSQRNNHVTLPWLSTAMLGLGIASTLLLVYASLVPLQYTPLSWRESVDRWEAIRWLELGVGNRADWIANALVVIPSAFFLSGAVDYGRMTRWTFFLASPLILLSLGAIVLGIELVQVWFPPRTVSQNDIFAGWVGVVAGLTAWSFAGRWMAAALETFVSLGSIPERIRWIAGALCLASVAYTLYPLDFIVSGNEFQEKVAIGRIRWSFDIRVLASLSGLKSIVLSVGKLFPFGVWFGLNQRNRFPWFILLVLAIVLEAIQIPIFSKFATEWDVIASVAGGWMGWFAAKYYPVWCRWLNHSWIWSVASALWSIVLVALFNARFSHILDDQTEIAKRWQDFFTPPLLRYYYTSEYSALSNLAGKLGVFGTLGILVAFTGWVSCGLCTRIRFWLGLLWAVGLGALIEIMQVYLPPMIADASDIGIYAIGFATGYIVLAIVMGRPDGGST